MEIIVAREWEYVPEFNGNRESGGDVVCTMQMLTPTQRDQCVSLSVDARGQQVVNTDMTKLVRWGAKAIKGLTVSGIVIKNGADVCITPGLSDLFSELAGEILTKNERPDLKNS